MSAQSIGDSVPICDSRVANGDGRDHRNEDACTEVAQVPMVKGEGQSLAAQLPPELLSKIFSRLCDSWPLASLAEDTTESIKSVTYVCRRWRAVVLSMSSFWTYIDLTRPKRAELVLKRSQLHDPYCALELGMIENKSRVTTNGAAT